MPLLTVLSRDSQLHFGLRGAIGGDVRVAATRSWDRLSQLVRERPVTGIVIDSAALPSLDDADDTLRALRTNFPSVGTLLIARSDVRPNSIVRLGRAGLTGLTLVEFDCIDRDLPREIARATRRSTTSLVLRQLGARLPAAEHGVVRMALEGVLHGWRTDDLAAKAGWTRAHLSVRLRGRGLPSAGHMLVWAKLMHAGRWLQDPGRTAESISRQLEYSSGAAFRRALQNYVGGTPTWVRDNDGLSCVLSRFLDVCGLDDSVGGIRSVA